MLRINETLKTEKVPERRVRVARLEMRRPGPERRSNSTLERKADALAREVTGQLSCLDIASHGEQDFSWNKGVLQEVDIGSLHSFGARIRGQIILQHVGRCGFQRIPEGFICAAKFPSDSH